MAPVSPGGGSKRWPDRFRSSVLHSQENGHPRGCEGRGWRRVQGRACRGDRDWKRREKLQGKWNNCKASGLGCVCKPQARRGERVWPLGTRGVGGQGERGQEGVLRRTRVHGEGTFAGTDHLEHHLRGAPGVQPRLLVQQPLLLHLFLLGQSQARSAE